MAALRLPSRLASVISVVLMPIAPYLLPAHPPHGMAQGGRGDSESYSPLRCRDGMRVGGRAMVRDG